ncbi:hypothetical protein ACIQWZ_39860 [Streptomyces sp. NPDC098077]|uniref:hypothetical protein n=1 Tax=Streptomyces sp. NPDC098077 TaxID=3366093 RepID=UPI0037F1C825
MLYTFNYRAIPGFRAPCGRPQPLTVEVRATTTLTMNIQMLQDGINVFRANSPFGWVPPPAYRRRPPHRRPHRQHPHYDHVP